MAHKVCNRCLVGMPANLDYFYAQSNTRDGLTTRCKRCVSEAVAERRARIYPHRAVNRAAREALVAAGLKKCPKCERELPETGEFFHSAGGGRLTSYCKECRRSDYKAYRGRTLDERRAAGRAYYQSHKEEAKAYHLVHREELIESYQANIEKHRAYYQENRERQLAYYHNRRVELRPMRRAANHRHKAKLLEVGGVHTPADVAAQYARQRGRCYWCQVGVSETYHVDHVIPLSKGGSNGPENIVIACPPCNMKKAAKHPMDFAGRLC